MQYCLVYEDKNGYCKIIQSQGKLWDVCSDEEKAIQRLHSLAIPDCAEFLAIKPDLIPADLIFRDAWEKGDVSEPIKINFVKALAIHRKRIQEVADKKIEQLSREIEIALEEENTPLVVALRRTNKILRTFGEIDLTHCKNVEDIKYSIPKELHDFWDYYNPTR